MACIVKAVSDDDRIRDNRLEVGLVPISTCLRGRYCLEAKTAATYSGGHGAAIQITSHAIDVVESTAHHSSVWIMDLPFKSTSKVKAAIQIRGLHFEVFRCEIIGGGVGNRNFGDHEFDRIAFHRDIAVHSDTFARHIDRV